METEPEDADEEEESDMVDEEDTVEKDTRNGEGNVQQEATSREISGVKNWKSRRHNTQQVNAPRESPDSWDYPYVCYRYRHYSNWSFQLLYLPLI